ncbi:unnamed protein product [Chondrus crispus]|uniref:Uncharacterized protein n=1 Tax=Chondrus crispus TaxID=2769 RepID=R7QIT1_CHOCR|nr:unnamed protein product [Chondrus crispus]CDF37330.1 unnamed protein product [Chondrus crispus]|eukprot:XP_005717149.1 unnamed protein product [Chondrus crispus]
MPFCSHSVLTPSPQTHACGNRPHRGRRSCAKCRDHCTCPPRDPTEGRDAATHTKNLSQPGDANALRASTPQSCSCPSEPSDPWSECCSHCSLQLSAGRERRDATTFYRQKEHLPPVVTLVRSAREGDHRFCSTFKHTSPTHKRTELCVTLDEWWSTNDSLFCSYGRIDRPPKGVGFSEMRH